MRRRAARWTALAASAVAVAVGLAVAMPGRAQEELPAAPPAESPPAPAPTPKPDAARRAAARPPAEAVPAAPPSEQAWVRAEQRVNFRASPAPTAVPIGVVKTGDQVGVFERRGDWARIQVGDATGWIPSMHLESQPPPREHVAQLEAQVADLEAKLAAANKRADEQRAQLEELGTTSAERDAEMRRLTDENRDLRAGERWPYLVTGAGILGMGIAVGLLVRGGSRRSSSRIRF